jgi:hypothetical protein
MCCRRYQRKKLRLAWWYRLNLFVRNIPRLSVDIVTYLVIEDRETSMVHIVDALNNIEKNIRSIFPKLKTQIQKKELKLQINLEGAQIKIEVNQTIRGCITKPEKLKLSVHRIFLMLFVSLMWFPTVSYLAAKSSLL